MTWAATVRASGGQVEVRLTRASEAIRMAPKVARTLAATLLVVAEHADQGQGGTMAAEEGKVDA